MRGEASADAFFFARPALAFGYREEVFFLETKVAYTGVVVTDDLAPSLAGLDINFGLRFHLPL